MEHKRQLRLQGMTYVGHVREQRQNQELHLLNVEGVMEQVTRP